MTLVVSLENCGDFLHKKSWGCVTGWWGTLCSDMILLRSRYYILSRPELFFIIPLFCMQEGFFKKIGILVGMSVIQGGSGCPCIFSSIHL